MFEKMKKPQILLPVFVGLTVLVVLFTDFFYHAVENSSSGGTIGYSIGITLSIVLLLFVASATQKKFSLKKMFILMIVFGLLTIVTCLVGTALFNGFGFGAFHSAQYTVYILFGIELGVYIVVGIFAFQSYLRKIFICVCVILVAGATISIGCWAGLNDSIAQYSLKHEWELDAPEYEDGKLSGIYKCGVMTGDEFHDQWIDEIHDVCKEQAYMQMAYRTDLQAFLDYGKKLEKEGYVLCGQSEHENIVSHTYTKDGNILHTYFNQAEKSVRIITDPVSATEKEFSYSYTSKESDKTEIYQYSLMYDDNCGTNYKFNGGIERCGMNYIIKLADNSLILIDGGAECQSSDSAVNGFYDFCTQITGSTELRIACWICTHGHGDHIDFFAKFLRLYNDKVTLERYMYNFPSYTETDNAINSTSSYRLYRRLELYAPDAKVVKPHTGNHFTLGNVDIDILYTHEDAFDLHTSKTEITDFNDSSTVYRFTIGKQTFLLLGDINQTAQRNMIEMYTGKTLKSDIVQVAHHGYNTLSKLYPLIDAEYAFYPQGEDNVIGKENVGCYNNYLDVIQYTDPKKVYLINRFTYGLSIDSTGTITITEPVPYCGPNFTIGEFYDGSGV